MVGGGGGGVQGAIVRVKENSGISEAVYVYL